MSRTRTYRTRDCVICDEPITRIKNGNVDKPTWVHPGECLNKMRSLSAKKKRSAHTRPNARKEHTPAYMRYKNEVHRLSEKVYQNNINILNPNNKKRTLNGVEGGYQLDHIESVYKNFNEGIPAEQVSIISNLQLITWQENIKKNK